MEPVIIAIICAAAFGATVALAAFIRQLLLSRDKRLNDKAQQIALRQETRELESLRSEMFQIKRLDSHYQVLGSNKEAIQYLDQKIEELFRKKSELIQRYADVTLKESSAIISGEQSPDRKFICDKLKGEIDSELQFYENELTILQKRRAALWDTHHDLQGYLVDQEKMRNANLDKLYERHSNLLEKIFIRHNHNTENVARQTLEAGNHTFKTMVMAPILFLISLFKSSTGISLEQAEKELEFRDSVYDAEKDLNDLDEKDDDDIYDEDERDSAISLAD